MKYGAVWSREELILTLYLYCQIPFARTNVRNPEVVRLANLLGRTPSAVALKLGNFGAFDPLLAKSGITGLTHFSKADRLVWEEFYGKWDLLVEEGNLLLAAKGADKASLTEDEAPVISQPSGPTEQQRVVSVRLYQAFFRRTVLSSYNYSCCVCGINLPALLVASHIVPWSANHESRTDPHNGLSLCALHDKAFDRGLISVNVDFTVLVSTTVSASKAEFTRIAIENFQNREIIKPFRFLPESRYLEWHMRNVFRQ